MTVSEQLEKFIAENGGNERDALNVALGRLELAEKKIQSNEQQIELYKECFENFIPGYLLDEANEFLSTGNGKDALSAIAKDFAKRQKQ